MPLLPYLDKDIDDGLFLDMLIKELYHKMYPLILAEFRHKGDCTVCHASLTGNKGAPIVSTGTETTIQSPESIQSLAKHTSSDIDFNYEYSVAKIISEIKVGK